MRRARVRRLIEPVAPAALAIALLTSPAAHAGSATVYQCLGPGGAPAATDLLTLAPGEARVQLAGSCGNPAPGWDLRWGSATYPGDMWATGRARELRLDAPADTTIVSAHIERQMVDVQVVQHPEGATSYGLAYRLFAADGTQLERCGGVSIAGTETCQVQADGTKGFPAPSVELPGLSTSALRLAYGCATLVPQPAIHCYHSTGREGVGLGQLAVRLLDQHDPTVGWVAGPLVSDPVVRRRELALNAADRGLGLHRARLFVDGRLVEEQPYDRGAAGCRDLDPATSGYEFASGGACPTASTSRTLSFGGLPLDGEHVVRVVVEDATGNQTVALDRTATFDLPVDELQCAREGCVTARPRPGALNGVGASARARLSLAGSRTVRVRYGRRVTIEGRLRGPSGAAIADAMLDVASQTRRVGAAWRPVGQLRTDRRGAFRFTAAPGPSRTLRFAYRARNGDAEPAHALDVRLEVAAGLRFRATPGVVGPGGSVRVSGRLLGAGVARGTFVELQALDGREWRTFKTLGVRRGGRFAYRYRFRHTSGPARFLWRVHARAQAGLPYAAASSRAAWVRVRP
jgi:hypothetical protein